MEPDNSHLLGEALYGETPVMITEVYEEPDIEYPGCLVLVAIAYALEDENKLLFSDSIDKFNIKNYNC